MDVAEDAEAALDPRIQVRSLDGGLAPRTSSFDFLGSRTVHARGVLGYVPFVAVAVPNTAWYTVPLCFHFPSFARTDLRDTGRARSRMTRSRLSPADEWSRSARDIRFGKGSTS